MITEFEQPAAIVHYQALLRPFAYSLTKSLEAAEDLLQETFYRAIANQEKFHQGTSIKAWLFTIMRNIFINDYRRNKKYVNIGDPADNMQVVNHPYQVSKNGAERSFLAEDIHKALSKVSKDYTQPFLLYSNGFHYHEIAEKLDIPLGTVKSRIFFARKELQQKLKELGVKNSAHNN